ncbi:hypothetical protein F4776DRAFT_416966 [Hypoxylon sp. NC0597]|nr:hypothetical protein F4776DRAFT_416966 [Hypoxylon sp. NC0597]
MFASWKPVANSDGSDVFLCKRPHTFDPVTAKTERPVACCQCRAQKVRCTGERNGEGCSRCQALRRKCTYSPRRSSNSTPGEEASGFTDTESRPGPLELPTPAPTEDSGRPVSSASSNRTAHGWIHESQGSYSNSIDLSNFPLDHEFARYSAFALMGNCEVQSGRFVPQQILATPEHSLFRSLQHAGIYQSASEPATNCSPRTQSRLPQAESAFSSQTQTQVRDGADTPRSSGSDCECLHRAVILMDELEILSEPTNTRLPVDGILVAHRKALRQAEGMLACGSCAARVENMTILTFLVSKLTDLCCRAMSALSSRCATEASPPIANHPGPTEAPATVVGAYRLESEIEYIAVVRVLLRLGLDRLLGLVSALQGVGRRLGSETMGRRLGVCKSAIGGLLDGR